MEAETPPTRRRDRAGLSGTNLALTGDYNQRLVYQAIRGRGPITRAALIELTGLAKPTIAGIVRRLLVAGLVIETSRIYGGRGQPAAHLEADRAGCYSIGIEIVDDAVRLVVIDALGEPLREAVCACTGDAANADLRAAMPRLIGDIEHGRIIGIGAAAARDADGPGNRQHGIGLSTITERLPGIPVYIDDRLTAAVAGETLFGHRATTRSFFYILLDPSPVGGLVLSRGLYRGKHPGRARPLFDDGAPWAATDRSGGDDQRFVDDACRHLVPLLSSITCLLDPGLIVLGGPLSADLLDLLADRCSAALQAIEAALPSHAPVRSAGISTDAVLIGAACLPMRARLYPTEEALLKTLDHAA